MNNRIRLSLMLAPACLLTAWANSVIDVVTDNNYRLRGEIISYGKQGIVIKHPAMRQNAVILPSGIRALYFTGTASPDLRARDKIFMAAGHRDIIPCNIISITQDKVQYRDMLGYERSVPRSQVAGFRLNTYPVRADACSRGLSLPLRPARKRCAGRCWLKGLGHFH